MKNLSVLKIFDLMSPSAALGYGIARVGCHLSGDGDSWEFHPNGTMGISGYSYTNGTVPTAEKCARSSYVNLWIGFAIMIFYFLWTRRADYKTRDYFLDLLSYFKAGIERLLIEIIRLIWELFSD